MTRTTFLLVTSVFMAQTLVSSPASGSNPAVDVRCRRMLNRMVSAQSSRLLKELSKCSARQATDAAFERCTPFSGDDGNLHARETRMDRALHRVERHGDDKFPRNCTGASPDLFEPACINIVDSRSQLRRCVYNDHTLAVLIDLMELTRGLTASCRTRTIATAAKAWRDWIWEDKRRLLTRGTAQLARDCGGDTTHWATVGDAIEWRALPLQQMTGDD